MNWLQKISSVTFSLEGSHKISQPKTILSLSFELGRFVHEKGFSVGMNDITSDGDDFDNMTGILNWYVTDKVPEEQQIQLMQEWIQEMQLLDYQMKVTGPDVSGMNTAWGDPMPENPLMVYRIHVLKNGSEDYMQVPEMNLANTNAKDLVEALGIPFDWSGEVGLNELKTKLEMFTPWNQQDLTKPREEGGGEGTGMARWVDFGRTEDQVTSYIDRLSELVNFGLKNGFEKLTWY